MSAASRRSRRLPLCALIVILTSGTAEAASGNSAITSFSPDFFARTQPTSAYDMIECLPGFRLQEGDAKIRGYSGSAGNVLLDGRRPASKEDTLEEVLKRVPAGSVDHIELIRSSAGGYDMQGYALLANVVRKKSSQLTGRLEAEYAKFPRGYSNPRIAGEASFQWGDHRLDLQAARYNVYDDEHGFGSRNRYAEDGSPIRLADYAQPEGTHYTELSGTYSQPLAGGSIRASGIFKEERMFANIRHDITFPEPGLILGTERNLTRSTEGELRYDRPLGASDRIELIGIRRDARKKGTDTSLDAESDEINRSDSKAAESILRGVFRHQGSPLSIEAGAEGAINTLDSHVALVEDGVDVPLPATNVRVEEKRAELFATGTWRLSSKLSVETGARYEMSRLTQSGDSALAKSLSYLKPRLLVTYSASKRDQLRLLVEREVGQLDFDYFVSDPSLTSGTITAGNRNLEPDTLWRAELAWERSIGAGSLVLTGRHEWVRNVIDRVPVISSEGVFDSVGNIGNGRRDELQIDANLPLGGIGLKGVTIKGSGLFRKSRVTDPQTGLKRRISDDGPLEATASLTHDIRSLKMRWGVNYAFRTVTSEYKINEVQRDTLSGRVDAFVEYKPDVRWTLRLFGKNLSNSPAIRRRWISQDLRGSSGLNYREDRILRSGRYAGINVQWAFGG